MDKSDSRKLLLIALDAVGLAVCVGALVYLAWLQRGGADIPNIAWVTLGGLITHFGNGLLTAHNYDFGSSAGSRAKDLRSTAADPEPAKEP
jgi:hypothetical protein